MLLITPNGERICEEAELVFRLSHLHSVVDYYFADERYCCRRFFANMLLCACYFTLIIVLFQQLFSLHQFLSTLMVQFLECNPLNHLQPSILEKIAHQAK